MSRAHRNSEEKNKVLESSMIIINYCITIDEYCNCVVNNNNNIYLLQMGCHPVAVITLHIFPNTANKFT
jgi:hypothetical protein